MKKRKLLRSILALGMAVCLVLPGTAVAAVQESTGIAYEDLSQRKENSRVYQKKDNSFVSVSTAAPMHFWKNGQWTSIDNSLNKKRKRDGSKVYVNTSNPYQVELPERLSKEHGVTLSKEGYSLTFTLQNTNRSSLAAVEKKKAAPGASEAEEMAGLENLSASITYNNVQSNIDVQYIVSQTQLKENLILEKKPSRPVSFTYRIDAGGLNAVLQNDNRILFQTSKGNSIFEIPAPIMQDHQMNRSMEIGVSLNKAGETAYTLTYTPSMQWLAAAERSYPVLVDPVVLVRELTHGQLGSMDTYVDSKNPDANYTDSDLLTLSSDADSHTILYVVPQPALTTFKKVVKKALVRYHKAGEFRLDDNAKAGLFSVTGSMPNHFTYPDRPSFDEELPVDIAPMSGRYLEFDITRYVRELGQGSVTNNGLAVKMIEGTGNAWYDSVEAPDASWLPVYVFEYTNPNGANTSYTSQEWDMGRAGIVRFQEFTQQLSIERTEIGYPHGRMPVEIKRVFNSGNSSFTLEPISNFNSSYGAYWQTNYDQSVTPLDTPGGSGLYLYISGDGTPIYFQGTGQIVNHYEKCTMVEPEKHPGKDLELYYPVDPPKELEHLTFMVDNQQMVYVFHPLKHNKLICIVSLENLPALLSPNNDNVPCIMVNHLSNEVNGRGKGRIDYIMDGDGRKYMFHYNDKLYLTSISLQDPQGHTMQTIAYTYYAPDNSGSIINLDLGKFFKTTTFPDGKEVSYEHVENLLWFPGRIVNTQQKTVLDIGFNVDSIHYPVTSISYGRYQDDLGHVAPINTLHMRQLDTGLLSITDENENTQIKKFDLDGNLERITTPAGRLLYQRGENGNDYDVNQGFSENLVSNAGFETGLDSWNSTGIVLGTGDAAHSGSKSAMMINNAELSVQQPAIYQRYTANAYVMTPQGVADIGAKLVLEAMDAQGTVIGSAESSTAGSTQGEWRNLSLDYALPFGAETVRAKVIGTGSGIVYTDDVTLQKSGMALGENLVQNSDFTVDPLQADSSWTLLDGTSFEWFEFDAVDLEERLAPGLNSKASVFSGNPKQKAQLSQTVHINAKAGDQFCISAWALGANVFALKDGRTFGICVEAPSSDGNTAEVLCEYSFDPYTNNWQYGAKLFTLDRDVENVTVRILYDYQNNRAAFDGISLNPVLP